MADVLQIVIAERRPDRLRRLAEFLDRDSREDFLEAQTADDVADLASFDDFDFPGEISSEGDLLFVAWWDEYEVQLESVEALAAAAGCTALAAHVVPDNAMASSQPIEDSEGYFYVRRKGGLMRTDSIEAQPGGGAPAAVRLDPNRVKESLIALADFATRDA